MGVRPGRRYVPAGRNDGAASEAYISVTVDSTGRAVLPPYNEPSVGIFDPVEDTYSDGPAHGGGRGRSQFGGISLVPDGRLIVTPFDAARIGIISVRGHEADNDTDGTPPVDQLNER